MFYIYLLLLIPGALSEETQKFTYQASDSTVIAPNSILSLLMELSTGADEYLGSSLVKTTLSITRDQATPFPYSILHFNYDTSEGRSCYQKWFEVGLTLNEFPCQDIESGIFEDLPTCGRYIECSSESINMTSVLQGQFFKDNFLLVQNEGEEAVMLATTLELELLSQNSWFYWGVGLTCLLLVSLVIFSGVVFYWLLKYKRVKKMFEQFKLTQENIAIKQE